MAIDNDEKRKSAAGALLPLFLPGVTTTEGPDDEWRQQVGYSYSGILADPPAPFLLRHNNPAFHHHSTAFEHNDEALDHNDPTLDHLE